MQNVEHAIILAAGQGTRMLPASLYAPKEILPLVDNPSLNHLIWEACRAGVKKIHIIISPRKKNIIEEALAYRTYNSESNVRPDLPNITLNPVPDGVDLIFHEQKIAGGVGDAIEIASEEISSPFLVLLGDNLLIKSHDSIYKSGPNSASESSKRLVEYYKKTGLSCAGVIKVEDHELQKYGVIEQENEKIINIIEKPTNEEAPSNLVLCGRYLLPSNTSEIMKLYPKNKYGELQSIELFNHIIRNNGLGYVNMSDYKLYDSGNPYSWLKSQIDHALRREDLKDEFKQWLRNRLN
mgnify:CR=1 FL=1